jgi:hypothetical protein
VPRSSDVLGGRRPSDHRVARFGQPNGAAFETKWLNRPENLAEDHRFVASSYPSPKRSEPIRMMPTAIWVRSNKMLSVPGRRVDFEGY